MNSGARRSSKLASASSSRPAAELTASSDSGFVSHHEAVVSGTPQQVWVELVKPAGWWNGAHSYSGDAANMTIAPVAGGCFCEWVPGQGGVPAGQVEHMRVIHVAPYATLRLTGALGPLQGEAVTGVLTVAITPSGTGSKLVWDYVVGGYMRMPMAPLAPVVDQVIGEQFKRLAARFAAR